MELSDVVQRTDSGEFGLKPSYGLKPWLWNAWDAWCGREGITLDQLMSASDRQLRVWHMAFAESLG